MHHTIGFLQGLTCSVSIQQKKLGSVKAQGEENCCNVYSGERIDVGLGFS